MFGTRETLIALATAAFLLTGAAAAEESDLEFFERRVRPLLVEHCIDCHGPDAQENGLRLDRAADLFAGGDSGKAIDPGNPSGSLLIAAVQYASDDLQMPPDGKLSDSQIAVLVRWVERGAKHPGGAPAGVPAAAESAEWQARQSHWSLMAPVEQPLPPVANESWVQTSIDRFIAADLEAAGLSPAAAADRRTLIRRATFDLTGLPPTPAEIRAFLDDESPRAFAQVVDRLLASPHYGERWGRHWLDIARYADSNGLDENVAHGNAWRYRDWVIASINRDLPYDQFVREQIAGDLLPTDDPRQRNDRLIATGFLSLGPKVLAEVDKVKMEMDIIDEQIDTVGKSLLGLTLGCARCHDHKFDPITTRDYYALAGIFKSTHTMDSLATIARWHEHELHDPAHEQAREIHASRLAAKRQSLDAAVKQATDKLQAELGAAAALPAKPEESFPPETRAALLVLRAEVAAIEKQAPQPPTAMGVREGEVVDVAVHTRGSHLTLGDTVERGIPELFAAGASQPGEMPGSGRLALANWIASERNPLTARVMANRVWRWHFGRGLVATPDNFGLRGSKPSNQALLDHLALEFARDWSLKALHRRIMLSATYQQSSACSTAARQADPENRLFGRAPVRRLQAEQIRDAMLAVAGSLDYTAGGPSLATENRTHVFDHTSKDATSYESNRRSVYLPVVRNHLHESFTLFDYADASAPNGDRGTSTVPSQALYLLNSQFAANAAGSLASRVQEEAAGGETAIHLLYELAYGRAATAAELGRAQAFLERIQPRVSSSEAWQLLCQNVLMSNEFLYLR